MISPAQLAQMESAAAISGDILTVALCQIAADGAMTAAVHSALPDQHRIQVWALLSEDAMEILEDRIADEDCFCVYCAGPCECDCDDVVSDEWSAVDPMTGIATQGPI